MLFYKTKDCFSPINTMFSLLSRNPMATFQVSQVSTYIVHPCNEEYGIKNMYFLNEYHNFEKKQKYGI